MEFMEHLDLLLGGTAGKAELRQIAMTAVAGSARELKLTIAGAVWEARALAAENRQAESARRMGDVRRLRDRYRASLEEYGRLASSDSRVECKGGAVPGEQHGEGDA